MTPTTIIQAVCDVFPVQPADIPGPRRRRNEADARRTVAALCHKYLRMSNAEIGQLLNRSAGAITGERTRHEELLAVDPQYRRWVNRVLVILNVQQQTAA